MKRILLPVCLVIGALLALPATASADSQPMPFVTSVSHLVDRPDSGNHGDWAKDNLTRTTRLYRVSEFVPCPEVEASTVKITAKTKASDDNVCAHYVGTVWDEGTFTTLADAKSPNKGVALKPDVKGHVEGGLITTEFIGHYRGDKWASDQTFEGKDGGASTTNWVKKYFDVFSDEKYKYGLADWGWDYTTACERWSDHSDTNGAADKDGDITGKTTCPSPSPSPSPSATPTPAPSATPTPATDKPGMPKTGVLAV